MCKEEGMEKYGTDTSALPVTDDQKAEYEKLAMEKKAMFVLPKNYEEAEQLIVDLKLRKPDEK